MALLLLDSGWYEQCMLHLGGCSLLLIDFNNECQVDGDDDLLN